MIPLARAARPAFVTLLAVGASALAAQERIAITIDLDPRAAAHLQETGERVTVESWFYGEPVFDDVPTAEMGQVWLADEVAHVAPKSQVVWVGGSLGGAPFEDVIEPMVNVNVFTGSRVSGSNALDCGILEGPVAELAAAGSEGNVIACALLPIQ